MTLVFRRSAENNLEIFLRPGLEMRKIPAREIGE